MPQRRHRQRKIQDTTTWMYCYLDVLLQDQPKRPSPTVVQPKRHLLNRATTGTRLGIAHPLPRLHPPGVGLDFLLQIHDRRNTSLGGGRAAIARSARLPRFFSPQECCEVTAARTGSGVLFSHSWAGFSGRGLPRRRGRVSAVSRLRSLFRLRQSGP